MRHVAFLIPTIDRIGGAEQQVISLAVGLSHRGSKVNVIALSGAGGDAADHLRCANIDFLSLGMRKGLVDPRGWVRLCRWVRTNRPEVVHAHLPHAALLARWSRIVSPVRALVDTIHSPSTGGKARKLGYRISSALPDVVTAVSCAAAGPWLASRSLIEENLAIISNGIDTARFRPDEEVRTAMRNELELSDEFLWIAVGRLDPVKDHATLLHAFRTLPPNARLIIAGDGPLRNHLKSLLNHLGLHNRARLIGFEPDVYRLLQAADGFVLCSRWEGMPIALLEASACELPSVVTDIEAAREVLQDLTANFSVRVGDSVALASSMRNMMSLSTSKRSEIGRSARDSVISRFSLDAALDQWEALYDDVLATNLHPRRFGRASPSQGRTFQLQ